MTSTLIYILDLHTGMQSISNNFFSLESDAWCFATLSCPMPLGSAFGIVKPFPENIYPLEFTKADVTCIAFDAKGIHIPEKIKFMRRDQFNRFKELKPNENLRFTNKSEQEGKYCVYIQVTVSCWGLWTRGLYRFDDLIFKDFYSRTF